MLLVFGIENAQDCNLHLPIGPLSVQIESTSKSSLVLIKKDLEKDYGNFDIVFNILDKATTSGYMPRQIITEVDQKIEYHKVTSSDDEDEECDGDNLN